MAVSNILKSDNMELLEKLQTENRLLLEENKKLNDTVGWMHDTIWRLVRRPGLLPGRPANLLFSSPAQFS